MKTVDSETFDSQVMQSSLPVLVSFVAAECKPCALMQADLEDLEAEYFDALSMVRITVDGNDVLADRFSIIRTPTIVMFSGGKPVMQVIGYTTKHDLKQKIDDQLKTMA